MDIRFATLEELKKYRPDLYQAVRQEVCLGELKMTKDDIVSLIEPLSESLKEYLEPHLSGLPAMTYNDIVDMENDIIDEISEQLQDELVVLAKIARKRNKEELVSFEEPLIKTLDDLKRHRPELCDALYDEFLMGHPLAKPEKPSKPKEEAGSYGVKVGDVLRWNYTKEEGIVVGFTTSDGKRNFIVEQYDGRKITFENDPRLFTVLKGEERDAVISKRKQHKGRSKKG